MCLSKANQALECTSSNRNHLGFIHRLQRLVLSPEFLSLIRVVMQYLGSCILIEVGVMVALGISDVLAQEFEREMFGVVHG